MLERLGRTRGGDAPFSDWGGELRNKPISSGGLIARVSPWTVRHPRGSGPDVFGYPDVTSLGPE